MEFLGPQATDNDFGQLGPESVVSWAPERCQLGLWGRTLLHVLHGLGRLGRTPLPHVFSPAHVFSLEGAAQSPQNVSKLE